MTDEFETDSAAGDGTAEDPRASLEERIPQIEVTEQESAAQAIMEPAAEAISEEPEVELHSAVEPEAEEMAPEGEEELPVDAGVDAAEGEADEGSEDAEADEGDEDLADESDESADTDDPTDSDETADADNPTDADESDDAALAVASETALADVGILGSLPKVPWWPFLILLAAWLGVVAGSLLTLSYETSAAPLVQQESYAYVILAGLVLAILGPIVSLTVWLVMWWRAEKGERGGLLTVSLVRGAGVTLLGVLAWWGVIVAMDALRLGLIG